MHPNVDHYGAYVSICVRVGLRFHFPPFVSACLQTEPNGVPLSYFCSLLFRSFGKGYLEAKLVLHGSYMVSCVRSQISRMTSCQVIVPYLLPELWINGFAGGIAMLPKLAMWCVTTRRLTLLFTSNVHPWPQSSGQLQMVVSFLRICRTRAKWPVAECQN
jgi:hypothetical protein